jgi:plasmid stabilization system protein ParE
VAHYTASLLTEADIDDIAGFTVSRWGADQADRYIGGLESLFLRLAEGDIKGRPCDEIRLGLLRAVTPGYVSFPSDEAEF